MMLRAMYVLISLLLSPAAACAESRLVDVPITSIEGERTTLEKFAGRVLLIVNTASKCGFTPQYRDLEELQRRYEQERFTVLGFPSNDFGEQEPGTNEEIMRFCKLRFGVTFPLFEKGPVLGPGKQPVFAALLSTAPPELAGEIEWNFEKFLIDKEGKVRARFGSHVNPLSSKVTEQIEALLEE